MIRVLALLARRPDISREAFREHYETVHAPLALTVLDGVAHYVRDHITQVLGEAEPRFDVLSEFGYEDAAALAAMAKRLASEELGDPIRRDELQFMDKPRNAFFSLELVDGGAERSSAGEANAEASTGTKVVLLASAVGDESREAFAARHAREVAAGAGQAASFVTFRIVDTEHVAPFDAVTFLRYAPGAFDGRLRFEFTGDILQLIVEEHPTRSSPHWSHDD